MSVLSNLGKVGLVPKGDFSSAVTYERLDVVLYGSSSFVCLETSTGENPSDSEKWHVLAIGADGGGSIIIDKSTLVRAGAVVSVNDTEPEEGNVTLDVVPSTRTINEHSLSEDVTLTLEELNGVPTSRMINGKPLTDDVTLTASDIGIDPESGGTVKKVNNVEPDISGNVTLTAENVNAVPTSRTINGHELTEDISLNATDVGAKSADYEPDLSSYVPVTRTINSKALNADVEITAEDISAVPTSRTINNKSLISNVQLLASDVGALSSSTPVTIAQGGTGATTKAQARTNLGFTFTLTGSTLKITVSD